jgi:hypothetical protein
MKVRVYDTAPVRHPENLSGRNKTGGWVLVCYYRGPRPSPAPTLVGSVVLEASFSS